MGKLTDHNIKMLKERIIDTINTSNMNIINSQLKTINNSLIITGVGGSMAVCEFARKIIETKNRCFTKILDPRDLFYSTISSYQNILAISYSGNNYGVKLSFDNNLKKYLLTNSNHKMKDVNMIIYNNSIQKEKSFIALAATLMPISILLYYYLENNTIQFIDNIFNEIKVPNLPSNKNITIIYGNESITSAKFLETTFHEAGIAHTILSTKYNYCHGQTTLPFHHHRCDVIFFKSNDNDLDKTIISELQKLYDNIIIIENNIKDVILADYQFLIQSIYLIYEISKKYKKDLSVVKYAPAVKWLFHFKGGV